MFETSVIIRTKNEGIIFNEVLENLKEQTYQDFEIIIVDDNSTDKTSDLPFKYFSKNRIKIINVPEGKFTHPYATNLGADAAGGQYLVFINGHTIPVSITWLEDGLKNFSDDKVAGVYAPTLANKKANLLEKIFYYIGAVLFHPRREVNRKSGMGILATTNAIIRKSLWEKHNYDENFVIGGEDGEWADYWLKKGYVAILDPKFRVYHSHDLSISDLIKQYRRWQRSGRPSKDLLGTEKLPSLPLRGRFE